MKFARPLFLILTGAMVLAVAWFLYWTAGSPPLQRGPQSDYYNLLVDGFQEGSLAMKVAVKPAPPGSPPEPFLLDASFYAGRYYLYFGVTPAVLLFWPWTVVTGQDLPEATAAVMLTWLAWGLSVGWLGTMRRRFFPAAGAASWFMAVGALGLAAGYAVVLRRPLFYEVAILANVACTMGALWCLTLVVLRPQSSLRWLALASGLAGLAVGCRPTVGPGALVALGVTALYLVVRSQSGPGRRLAAYGRAALAAGGPVGGCLLLLAWYNQARFGSPWEFGLSHQQGSNPDGFSFTLASLGRNLGLYYLTPPSISWYFPFFAPGANPPGLYREQVHGQFFVLPVFLLAVAVAWRRGRPKQRDGWDGWMVVAGAVSWAGLTLLVEGMAPAHANRYQLDFHPVFLVLALLALAACAGRPGWRWAGRAAQAWLVGVALFNMGTSLHVHGFFQENHPATAAKLARIINRDFVWPVHRLFRPSFGGMEVMVRFAEGRPERIEPLVVTGGGPDMNALQVRYTQPGRGFLRFETQGYGAVESEAFDLRPGRARWLTIQHGGLYPPAGHPWYRTQPPGLGRARSRIAVAVDGVTVLDRDLFIYQASPQQVALGRRSGFLEGDDIFSGEIERVRTIGSDPVWLDGMKAATGAVRLRWMLPRDRFGEREPLVLTGRPGHADLVSITYEADGLVRFAMWHEGWPAPRESPPIAWDYLQPMDLRIALGSLPAKPAVGGEATGLRVEINDRPVWESAFTAYPAAPTEVYVGGLPWAVQGCRRILGGEIQSISREDEQAKPLRSAVRALLEGETVEVAFTLPEAGWSGGLPLLSTGITGRGDSVFLESLPGGRMRLGFDHWGSQPRYTEPVVASPGETHRLVVALGARVSPLATVPGRLQVSLDGRRLLDEAVDLFPAEADLVWFGENRPGLSTSAPVFPGGVRVTLPAAQP